MRKNIELNEHNINLVNHLFGDVYKDYDMIERTGIIKAPVFLAIGLHDYVCPYYLWDDYKDKLPNLSYNIFEKSGHWPMLEEQELFDKKLIEWIKSN